MILIIKLIIIFSIGYNFLKDEGKSEFMLLKLYIDTVGRIGFSTGISKETKGEFTIFDIRS